MDSRDAETILVIEDDDAVALTIAGILTKAGFAVQRSADGKHARHVVSTSIPAAICLDLGLPDCDGLDLMNELQAIRPGTPMVVLTADSRIESVVAAMRAGAENYLTKPVVGTRLLAALRKAMDGARAALQATADKEQVRPPTLVGSSAPMMRLYDEVSHVANTGITVLLHGESGTGKELLAHAVHDQSSRRHRPMIAVNCAAIPESLHEAELFGYEKGAFTGATQRTPGKFELADGGTLFLDEVGELSPSLQAKLLRVLQEKTFYRVGGTSEITVDFRLIAATHRDLTLAVESGAFREDLFFRLAAFELEVPPLRERSEDIVPLANHFLAEFSIMMGRPLSLDAEVAEALLRYHWPGNVRELRNCLHRACIFATNGLISVNHLGPRIRAAANGTGVSLRTPTSPGATGTAGAANALGAMTAQGTEPAATAPTAASVETSAPPTTPLPRRMRDILAEHSETNGQSRDSREREVILEALAKHAQNLSQAARALGIGRTTLYRKMKKHGVS